MADTIVNSMRDGDFRKIKSFIDTLSSINQYIHEDEENCLNMLHLAAGLDSEHREAVIELLIERYADLNYPGTSENTGDIRALHLASMWGYDLTVKLLLYHGADASIRDGHSLSPIDYASLFDNHLCTSLLLRYGSLNSTSTAWSAIMDTSLDESNPDSSFETQLYHTALDFGDNGGDGSDKLSNLSTMLSELDNE